MWSTVKQICVEPPSSSSLNMTRLLLSTGACNTAHAAHQRLSIDISCPQDAQQQTRRPPSIDGTDRRTDGQHRTNDRYIDPASHCRPMRTASKDIPTRYTNKTPVLMIDSLHLKQLRIKTSRQNAFAHERQRSVIADSDSRRSRYASLIFIILRAGFSWWEACGSLDGRV